jgi:manganese transport protein
MAAGSIFSGIFSEPYDSKDNHSRLGIAISFVVALLLIFVISNPFNGLIYSQMVLSIQLPITIFVQVWLTSSEEVMGKYKNSRFYSISLYFVGAIVTALNIALFISFFN